MDGPQAHAASVNAKPNADKRRIAVLKNRVWFVFIENQKNKSIGLWAGVKVQPVWGFFRDVRLPDGISF